jgi:hypothetical protein
MDFKTGGMAGEIVLGELTGNVSPLPTFYSSDNVYFGPLISRKRQMLQQNKDPCVKLSKESENNNLILSRGRQQ